MQSDLFPAPIVSGLAYAPDFVTTAEDPALIANIDASELSPFRFQGWLGKRLTASFGWHYDFDTARFAPAAPMPDWMLDIRSRVAAFASLSADELAQARLIRYDPGAGIGWHRDRPLFEHVIGVSLGVPAIMRFRRRRAGASTALPRRWHRARSTICRAKRGMTGNIISWLRQKPAGQSRSAACRIKASRRSASLQFEQDAGAWRRRAARQTNYLGRL